jgi:hypothetical protein
MPKFCGEIGLLSRHDCAVFHENLVMNKVGCIADRTSIAPVAVLARFQRAMASALLLFLPTSDNGSSSAITRFAATGLAAAAKRTVELRRNVGNSSCLIVSPTLGEGPRNQGPVLLPPKRQPALFAQPTNVAGSLDGNSYRT